MKKPAPRKPKDLYDNYCFMHFFVDSFAINASLSITSSKQCRKYAAWLIKAAEYLESKQ